MVDPATTALIGEALKNPKDVGEGVSAAATGIGGGVSTAATGIGGGVATAATGIGGGFRESKMGDAAVAEAEGKARGQIVEAHGSADAKRIQALAALAASIKDLPPETQKLILEKAQATQPEPEAPKMTFTDAAVASGLVSPWTVWLADQASHRRPGTHITCQRNIGACRAGETYLGQGA